MSNLPALDPATFIEGLRSELMPIANENGQTFDRLRTVFMIAVQQNPDILDCTPESLRRELSKCAADGLVPDSKEAVLLPYKEGGGKVANYQPMVHGVIKRLRELGGVFQIVCNLVYANDIYDENEADPESLVHKSPGFGEDRGAIVGGYVIFRDDQKRIMHFEKMSRADFDKIRAASKSPNSPAWVKWYEEMCKKAVLRRGSKWLSTNNDKIRALIERTDTMFDLNARPREERMDPFTGQQIEHDAGAAAISHQRTETAPMDTGRQQEREPVQQQQRANAEQQQSAQSEQPGETKAKPELPMSPPDFPDVSVGKDDHALLLEAVEKILDIALHKDIDAGDRRGNLRFAADHWGGKVPEYARPLIRACIDMSDWAIRRDAEGLAWAAEHAAFVFKAKTLFDVEKLKISKYP